MFASFFQGGFECSTHLRPDGRRLDITRATAHDRLARQDYSMLAGLGVRTIRDGLRWHLIERRPGRYDWDSFLPMLHAASEARVEVIWDLLHFGWPDMHDIWSPDFPARFADFSAAAMELIAREGEGAPMVCPVNEISFLAWGGGDHGFLNPFARGRGPELKRQLVRASVAASRAVRAVEPRVRLIHTDPAINVIPDPARPWTAAEAAGHTEAQFQAWDMISGRLAPELGGRPDYLDVIGINYYCHNQWICEGPPLDWQGQGLGYVPPRDLFARIHHRYGRPIFLSETGIEAAERPYWLRYICDEVAAARAAGTPVQGVCLYPVMNHPGWDDDRHCPNGLIDYDPATFERWLDEPLLMELRVQQARFARGLGGPRRAERRQVVEIT